MMKTSNNTALSSFVTIKIFLVENEEKLRDVQK